MSDSSHILRLLTAIKGLLQSQSWPDGFDSNRIYIEETEETKDESCIVIYADGDPTEYPPNTGNYWHPVRVEVRTPVTLGSEQLATHQAVAATLESVMMNDDLPTELTSIGSGLTVFGISERQLVSEQSDELWIAGVGFQALSCPRTF